MFIVLAQLLHLGTFVWRHRDSAYAPALNVTKVSVMAGLAFLPWVLGMLVLNYLLADDTGSASWLQEPTLTTLRDIFHSYAGIPVSCPIIALGNSVSPPDASSSPCSASSLPTSSSARSSRSRSRTSRDRPFERSYRLPPRVHSPPGAYYLSDRGHRAAVERSHPQSITKVVTVTYPPFAVGNARFSFRSAGTSVSTPRSSNCSGRRV